MPLSVVRGPVATLEIDRRERANAYTRELLAALSAAIDDLSGDAVAVVVQTAGDGAFSGGADLDELRHAVPADAIEHPAQRTFEKLARAPFVTICAVHGAAVAGGMELALACDLRVAGPRARFSLPEPALGLIPSAGGCARLARLLGSARAREVVLGGTEVDARTALAWGLVHRIADDPRAEAHRWAERIATRDPCALRLAKAVLADEIDAVLERERDAEALLYGRRGGDVSR